MAKKLTRVDKLKIVRLGLEFHVTRLTIMLQLPVCLVVGVVLGLIVNAGWPLVVVAWWFLGAALATPILGLVGSVLCLWAPRKNLRKLMLISLCFDGVDLLLGIVASVLFAKGELTEGGTGEVLVRLSQLMFAVSSWFVFMYFLRGFANYLREWGSANDVSSLIAFGAILVAGPTLGAGVAYVIIARALNAPRESTAVVVAFMGVLGIAGVIFWVVGLFKFGYRYLEILSDLRKAIANHVEDSSPRVKLRCQKCQGPNDETAKFCNHCGAAI